MPGVVKLACSGLALLGLLALVVESAVRSQNPPRGASEPVVLQSDRPGQANMAPTPPMAQGNPPLGGTDTLSANARGSSDVDAMQFTESDLVDATGANAKTTSTNTTSSKPARILTAGRAAPPAFRTALAKPGTSPSAIVPVSSRRTFELGPEAGTDGTTEK